MRQIHFAIVLFHLYQRKEERYEVSGTGKLSDDFSPW